MSIQQSTALSLTRIYRQTFAPGGASCGSVEMEIQFLPEGRLAYHCRHQIFGQNPFLDASREIESDSGHTPYLHNISECGREHVEFVVDLENWVYRVAGTVDDDGNGIDANYEFEEWLGWGQPHQTSGRVQLVLTPQAVA